MRVQPCIAAVLLGILLLAGCVKTSQLHEAATYGDFDQANELIGAGAIVWWRDFGGETALHKSTFEGYEDITELLLENGQNPNSRTYREKFAPMHYAAINGNPAIVEALIEHGAIIDVPDKKKRTPLYMAAGEGNDQVVKLLLEYDADPNAISKGKYGPLHAAAYTGDIDSATLLIEAGATIDLVDNRGNTPLLWAASSDQIEMAMFLIIEGAMIDYVNNDGSTAMEWALRNENAELARLLAQNGASYDAEYLAIRLRTSPQQVLAMINSAPEAPQ